MPAVLRVQREPQAPPGRELVPDGQQRELEQRRLAKHLPQWVDFVSGPGTASTLRLPVLRPEGEEAHGADEWGRGKP